MTNTPTKKEMLKFVKELYLNVCRATESTRYFGAYEDIIIKSEKQHRKGWSDFKYNITVSQAAMYFAVKYLFDAKFENTLKVKDIIHCKLECFHAVGIYDIHKDDLEEVLTEDNWEMLKNYDYSEYVK